MTRQPRHQVTAKLASRGFSREAVEELSWLRGEPDWMRARRLEAWRIYEDSPMPTRTDDGWRRTDLSGLQLESFIPYGPADAPVASPAELPAELQQSIAAVGQRAGLVLQHNSEAVYGELAAGLAGQGVILTSLDEAVRQYPDLVQQHYLPRATNLGSSKFAALSRALGSGGVFLYLPQGVQVEMPVHSLLWSSKPGLATFSNIIVIAEAGSSLTFVDEQLSPSLPEQGFHSGVVEIFLGEGAGISYLSLQDWSRSLYNFTVQRTIMERDSTFRVVSVALGGRLSRVNADIQLVGPGADARISGIFFGEGSQFFDYHTLQNHVAPYTQSDLLLKGALKGQSRSVFEGLIRITKPAQRSNAYQVNRNLLLSHKAKADSVPMLEIEANDVHCTHGVSVGQLDEEQRFYLMSRGLSLETAEHILVEGFFEPVIAGIVIEGLREKLRQAVAEKIRADDAILKG